MVRRNGSSMYCPNCERSVGGKKVVDTESIGLTACLIAGVFVVICLVSPAYSIAPLTLLCYFVYSAYRNAPLECPLCRTRLVNPLGGELPPTCKAREEAVKSDHPAGYCMACKAQNSPEAKFCSQCGQSLA